jgi:hypothetical protein
MNSADYFLKSLKPCPVSGNGVHRFLYHAARKARRFGLTKDEAEPLISELMTREPSPASEVMDALCSAYGDAKRLSYRWPDANPAAIERITAEGPTLLELWRDSPLPLPQGESRAEEFVDFLFPGNPLLCVGQASFDFKTRLREEWRGVLDARQLIVPSPMTSVMGKTKPGKPSYRSEDNTGPRRYLVVEFDAGGLDQHAAVLHHLGKRAPLAMAVYSGNKSLHGWFFCEGQMEGTLYQFMHYAVSLGADRATFSRSQFVRLPDGQRREPLPTSILPKGFPPVPKGRQAVTYANPGVIK